MLTTNYLAVINRLGEIIKGTEFENHVYTVGGCERDFRMGRQIKDIDIVVDLENGGINFAKWLSGHSWTVGSVVIYEHYGTAMFRLAEFPDIELEAVQTRKECYRNMESRNPDTAFGTIYDDCTRRDFTYNALYHNVSTDEVCDFNGRSIEDLEANILRTCGNPDIIFTEDPLRILRAVRFSSRFNSTIEEETYKGMCKYADRLSIISKERIQEEFNKIITCNKKTYALELLWKTKAMRYIVPAFNTEDLDSIAEYLERGGSKNDLVTNLAIIMYFASEPEAFMRALKYSNDIVSGVMFLIDAIPFIDTLCYTPMSVRRLQYKCNNEETFERALDVYYGLTGDRPFVNYLRDTSKAICYAEVGMFNYKLPVDGNDVMAVLNIGPCKEVKEKLALLIEKAYLCPAITKDECIKILKENE